MLVLSALVAQATPPTTDPVVKACGADRDPWLCEWLADVTDSSTAGDVGRWLSPWVSILLIVVGAVLASRLSSRIIRRSMRRWERGERRPRVERRGARRALGVLEKTSPIPSERRHQRAETIAGGLRSLARIIIWIVATVLVLSVIGIDARVLITSAGLIGVALGFGAQNLLRDLISGTFIIFEDQIGVGDVVDVGLASGTVEEVTLRTTRLRDVEGVVWYVPNGAIPRVGNKSQQWSRAVVDIPIAYGADIDRAQQVIKTAAVEMSHDEAWATRMIDEPEVWGVESLGLDTVTIRLVVKTLPLEQWRVARALRARVKRALDAAGIASPAPPVGAAAPERPARPAATGSGDEPAG
jgi:small conductance mechanosensitive channel